MIELTKDFVRTFARCWAQERVEQALLLWPDPVTWAWFLGEHLVGMSRADAAERFRVALGALWQHRDQLPASPAHLAIWQSRAPMALWQPFVAKLGVLLDEPDAARVIVLTAELRTLLEAAVPDELARQDELVPAAPAPPPPETP